MTMLETEIKKLTAAVEALTAQLANSESLTVAVESTPAAPAEEVQAPAAPTPPSAEAPAPQVTAPSTPEPATPTSPATPFSDHNGLMQYVMGKYQALGAEKGAQIQTILQGMGYANVNEVAAERYAEFYTQVEAIA